MSTDNGAEVGTGSLAELFHLVGRLVPDSQQVVAAPPNMTVAEAIRIMSDHNFTQLPVVAGKAVLGVFSFRSLAQRLLRMRQVPEDVGELPVDEFVEQFQFVQPSDNWESILKYLDREDGVLVGHREQLEGILTPMDVLGYLHRIASPFVMLAEIELSLRRIIKACVDEEGLRACVVNSLSLKYDEDALPNKLEEMTFNDYVQIVGDSRNWPHFTTVFGKGEWQRKTTTQRLRQVGELRNEVFHFRREITSQDVDALSRHREWLQMKARAFEATKAEEKAVVTEDQKPQTPQKPPKKRWNETSFLADLEARQGIEEAEAARQILSWAKAKGLSVRWGRGRYDGSCYPSLEDKRAHSPFGLWSNGYVSLHFGNLERFPPFDSARKRSEWLRRLNAIPGIKVADTETGKFPYCPLAALTNTAALECFLETIDWVIEKIEQASAGGPEEPTHEDYLRVLTHIPVPPGQQQLYKALYDAGDEGLTHEELVKVMGRRDLQDLSGVLGALGRRISGIPGYGEANRPGVEMVISYEKLADGQHRLRLVPEMRKALEELEPSWL